MAGYRDLLVGGLLLHFAALALAAVAEKSLVQTHAASGAARVNEAETRKALRGRRAQSSHGHRANIFRAAKSASARGGLEARQAQPVPIYIPKMGLANVTEPTAYPPLPPVLHPWKDMQPLDTAVGNYLISGLMIQPTLTPPPSQSSLDLAFACPALLTWPAEVAVSAPDPCGSLSKGSWSVTGGTDPLIDWETSCIDTTSPGLTAPSVQPVTTYTMPNGDRFGTSQAVTTPAGGSYIELRDCGGAAVFTIEEKIYKQTGKPDDNACAKYGSCDGVLYFQYFIKNSGGKVVGLSGYTTLFQDSWDITDSAGAKIVTVSRNGWEPNDRRPDCSATPKPRLWNLKYASSPPGIWAAATGQWPMAAMMTMLAARDNVRLPDGQVLWTSCNVLKSTGWVLFFGCTFCCCICIPMCVFLLCSASILKFVDEVEKKFFPKRMSKPAIYGN